MSDLGLYQVQRGTDVAGNLPPVDLPTTGTVPKSDRLNITIKKRVEPVPAKTDWEALGLTKERPSQPSAAKTEAPTAATPLEDHQLEALGLSRSKPVISEEQQVSAPQAVATGMIDSATFGTAPAIAGLSAAGATAQQPLPMVGDFPGLEVPAQGAALLSRGNEPAMQAAEQERATVAARKAAALEQFPKSTMAGELAGGLVTPGFGAASVASLPARLAAPVARVVGPRGAAAVARVGSGAVAGAAGGGLYGAGSTIGEGGSLPEAAGGAVRGAVLGAPTGGAFKGALGPRVVPKPASTPLQKTAQKAVEIGGPLPQGLTDYGQIGQAITAKLQEVPFFGSKIANMVRTFNEKAGEHVEGIANEMTGGTSGRDVANTFVKRGLNKVIENNKKVQHGLYGEVEKLIDTDTHYTLPRTDQALNEIMHERALSGETKNAAAGLEEFRNVAGGAPFQGVQRRRAAARNPSQFTKSNPGFDAGDFRKIYGAMSTDLRELVTVAAKDGKGKEALAAFQQAEREFGELADQNEFLDALVNSDGAAAVEKLIGAANEKGGNVPILAQLHQTMSKDDFAQVGGTILHELGKGGQNSEFSLTKFTKNWKALSSGAKRAMFSTAHIKDIDELTSAGQEVNRSLIQTNRSHTTGALLIFDTIKTIAEFAIAAGAGAVDPMTGVETLGGIVAGELVARWMAKPSNAAAMRAWGNSYKGLLDSRTPARIASFKLATRNLAHNLDIPEDKIFEAITKANEPQQDNAPSPQQPAQRQKNR